MSNFELEDRYLVIKRSDMKLMPDNYRRNFIGRIRSFCAQLFIAGAPNRTYLVLESDWPEYQVALDAIKKRMENQ